MACCALDVCVCVLSDVQRNVQYQYRIQVESDGLFSELSPALVYTHGEHFCADGALQGSV